MKLCIHQMTWNASTLSTGMARIKSTQVAWGALRCVIVFIVTIVLYHLKWLICVIWLVPFFIAVVTKVVAKFYGGYAVYDMKWWSSTTIANYLCQKWTSSLCWHAVSETYSNSSHWVSALCWLTGLVMYRP